MEVRQNQTTGNWELYQNGGLIATGTQQQIQAMAQNQVPVGNTATAAPPPPQGATGSNQQGQPGNWQSNPNTGIVEFTPAGGTPSWQQGGGLGESTTSYLQQIQNAEGELNQLRGNLQRFLVSDQELAGTLSSITSLWDSRIGEMREVNRRRERAVETLGYRLGSRYSGGVRGGVFGGVISEEERQGVARIGELEAKKQESIAAARQAAKEQNFKVFQLQLNAAEEAYKTKIETIKELNKTAVEEQKKRDEEIKLAYKDDLIFASMPKTADGRIDTGNLDFGKIYRQINFDAEGNLNKNDVSAKQILDTIKSVKENEKEKANKLSTDYNDFLNFKERNQLPQSITSKATEAEQFMEFKKQFKQAEEGPEDSLISIQRSLQIEKLRRELKTLDPQSFVDALPERVGAVPVKALGQATVSIVSDPSFSDSERQFITNALRGYIGNGEYNAAKEYLVKIATDSLGTESQTQAIGRWRAMDALDRIEILIEEAKQAGAQTGFFTGNVEKMANKLGATTNPKLREIGATIKEFLITYRKSQTGVAFGAEEAKDYKGLMPAIDNYEAVNITNIRALRDALDANQRITLESVFGPSNYQNIFGNTLWGREQKTILYNPESGEYLDATGISNQELLEATRSGWIRQ